MTCLDHLLFTFNVLYLTKYVTAHNFHLTKQFSIFVFAPYKVISHRGATLSSSSFALSFMAIHPSQAPSHLSPLSCLLTPLFSVFSVFLGQVRGEYSLASIDQRVLISDWGHIGKTGVSSRLREKLWLHRR